MRKRLLCGWIAAFMLPLAGLITACANTSVQQADASSLSQGFPAVFENSDSTKDSQHTFTFVDGADMSGSLTQLRCGFANYTPPAKYKEDADIRWDQPTNAANAFLYRLNFTRTPQPLVWIPDHDLGANNNTQQVAWSMPASFGGQVKELVTDTKPTVTVNPANQLVSNCPVMCHHVHIIGAY